MKETDGCVSASSASNESDASKAIALDAGRLRSPPTIRATIPVEAASTLITATAVLMSMPAVAANNLRPLPAPLFVSSAACHVIVSEI
jgi:hypothetical protein